MLYSVKMEYQESYLPTPRCRKLRYRNTQEDIQVEVIEIDKSEAPISLIEKDYSGEKEYRYYNDQLYTEVKWSDKHCGKEGLLPAVELKWYFRGIYDYWNYTKDECMAAFQADAKRYIIIDGVVYQKTGEPRYVVMTFGLGHNHGGTALMISNHYNSNINKKSYFTALQRNEAIASAKTVALGRGDTDYVESIGNREIVVLIPECITCNPELEAGEGDSFINMMESLISSSSSSMEAGLLAIAATANEVNKTDHC